jgi:hypothetical protein
LPATATDEKKLPAWCKKIPSALAARRTDGNKTQSGQGVSSTSAPPGTGCKKNVVFPLVALAMRGNTLYEQAAQYPSRGEKYGWCVRRPGTAPQDAPGGFEVGP